MLVKIANEKNYKESGLGKMLLQMREQINEQLPEGQKFELEEKNISPKSKRK